MFRLISLAVLIAAFAFTAAAQAPAPDWKALASELEKLRAEDQAPRNDLNKLRQAARAAGKPVDEDEEKRLQQTMWQTDQRLQGLLAKIVDQHGWPKKSAVGNAAATGAFLILQHAPPEYKERYVDRFRAAAMEGEADKSSLALLEDRLLLADNKPQRYGSQVDTAKDGVTLRPVEDEQRLDERRKEMGLEPICDYLNLFTKTYGPVTYAKCLLPKDQPAVAPLTDSYASAMLLLRQRDQPLAAYLMVERLAKIHQIPEQMVDQFRTFVGRDKSEIRAKKQSATPTPPVNRAEVEAVDALVELPRIAKSYRLVTLNESHFSQRHRAFAFLLMKELRAAGYTHFGMEALWVEAQALEKSGGPTSRSGFYTNDPFFADLIREAVRVGYQIFGYEQRPDQEVKNATPLESRIARERAQATNIKAVLDANPNAKILIYAGGSHGAKSYNDPALMMMGQHLMKMTGLELLAIDQQTTGLPAEMLVKSTAGQDGAALVATRPVLLRKSEGQFNANGGYDMSVYQPPENLVHGRGDWRLQYGYRKQRVVDLPALAEPSLLRARQVGLDAKAIPLDQTLVNPGETKAVLFLPVGSYELIREVETGTPTLMGTFTAD